MPDLTEALQHEFGFKAFRPGQQTLIQAVLDGRDALGILPTGSGKTLCYQLPGRLLGGTMIVIEPLLALMDDQVARLQVTGEKRVIALTSRLDPQDFKAVLAQLGRYRFVFMAPETLNRPDVLSQLAHIAISCLVIDEAHCISQWGPDFRPAYLLLGQAAAQIHPRCILALTATAPKSVQADITSGLHMKDPVEFVASVDRPNIFLGVEQVADVPGKRARLQELVAAVAGPTIIYVDRRSEAESLAAELAAKTGKRTAFYHAGLATHDRDLIQRQFMGDQLDVICATSAFGMGIDKDDVRLVVYAYVPESLEAYSQGIGRAGRDGQPAVSLVLITQTDFQRAAQFASSLPSDVTISTIYKHPSLYAEMTDPQISLIEAYIQAGFQQQAVKEKLAARLGEKQRSFAGMQAFLITADCKRQVLMSHFDSPQVQHSAWCCGEVTAAVLGQLPTHAPVKPMSAAPWQQVFSRIFSKD